MKSRIIKPEFFINEELAELPALARLLFAGLWCASDREGRLEYRPKRLKAEILPYDNCDVDKLLVELHNKGFIVIYEVDSKRYIQVVNFMKHQSIHQNEKSSSIPVYSEQSPELQGITGNDGELLPPLPIPLPIPSPVPISSPADKPPDSFKGYTQQFEEFWTTYPKKDGKYATFIQWQKLLKAKIEPDKLIAAGKNYAEYVAINGTEAKFILMGQTFLGLTQRRFEDYIDGIPKGGYTSGKARNGGRVESSADAEYRRQCADINIP